MLTPVRYESIIDGNSYLPKRTAFLFLDFAVPFHVTILVKRGKLFISGELPFSNKEVAGHLPHESV